MILILEYQGISLTYYYYLLINGKKNSEQMTKEIVEHLKCDMINIILTTTIPEYTLQNKIKPIEFFSPI